MSDLTCQGCGKSYGRAHFNLTRVKVAPNTEVYVCVRGSQSTSSDWPKESCVQLARNKLRACPGCGAQLPEKRWNRAALCEECAGVLERHRALGPPKPTKWVGLNGRILLGPGTFGHEAEHRPLVGLARNLAAALGYNPKLQPERFNYHDKESFVPTPDSHSLSGYGGSETFYLELPEDRLEALREFCNGLAQVGHTQYERGLARGHNVLGRLVNGEITVGAYEEQLPKKG